MDGSWIASVDMGDGRDSDSRGPLAAGVGVAVWIRGANRHRLRSSVPRARRGVSEQRARHSCRGLELGGFGRRRHEETRTCYERKTRYSFPAGGSIVRGTRRHLVKVTRVSVGLPKVSPGLCRRSALTRFRSERREGARRLREADEQTARSGRDTVDKERKKREPWARWDGRSKRTEDLGRWDG
jgi:hypothetical protein